MSFGPMESPMAPVVTPAQIERLRALLTLMVATVAGNPLTDSDDKKQLMRLWYDFNQSTLPDDLS